MKDLSKLVSDLQKGNLVAFDEIYQMTSKPIFFVAFSILKNKEDSEEIVQEVYIKFYRNIKNFKEEKNVFNWLYTVAKNGAINRWNQNKKKVQLDFEENIESDKDIYIDLEARSVLALAAKVLTAEEFQIITLCLIKGFKRREVSQIIKKPIPTVTWIYNNAIKKLNQILKGGDCEKD